MTMGKRNHRRMAGAVLAFCMLLAAAGCSPQSSSIPSYDDPAGLEQVMYRLSPWEDGSPDRSHDGRTPPEWMSDRAVFARWAARYIENERRGQYRKDYQPFAVPSSVEQAVAEQRAFEQAELDAREERMRQHEAEVAQAQAEREQQNGLEAQEQAQQEAEANTGFSSDEQADAENVGVTE
jgi:hypothetical protein